MKDGMEQWRRFGDGKIFTKFYLCATYRTFPPNCDYRNVAIEFAFIWYSLLSFISPPPNVEYLNTRKSTIARATITFALFRHEKWSFIFFGGHLKLSTPPPHHPNLSNLLEIPSILPIILQSLLVRHCTHR